MRKLLSFLAFLLPLAGSAHALTAPSLAEIMARVERASFAPRGHFLLFGHESIESCAYAAPGILVFDSYCYPAKAYPARALTIWSKELGEVELYEQDLDGGKFWRDVRLNEFPESVQQMFSFDFETVDSGAINGVFQKFYEQDNPACWSTSIDFNSGKPEAGCLKARIQDFPAWEKETQALVLDSAAWNAFYERILHHVEGK